MSIEFGKVKIRPVILLIAIGLIVALNIVAVGIIIFARSVEAAVLAAVIAFGANIATLIGTIASKLIESEEKGL